MIGVIISDVTNPFFPAVLRGAEDAAFGTGYRLQLCDGDVNSYGEVSYLVELRTYLPAGLLVTLSNFNELMRHAGTAGGTDPAQSADPGHNGPR